MNINIQELSWAEVRDSVKKVNPILAVMIDEFSPDNSYSFLKVSYPYGSQILENGVINLPISTGQSLPFNHDLIPESIKRKLSYSPVPMGLILDKSIEVYFETSERIMPSRLMTKGSIFGLWEQYDKGSKHLNPLSKNIWNLSAGARSLFMLPKISDVHCHARLKRDFGINEYAPKGLLDHCKVFRELAINASRNTNEKWECEVLFFTDKWSHCDRSNVASLKLHNYWLQTAWDQSFKCRKQMDDNIIWEFFANKVSKRNWKMRPYIINTLQHLFSVSEGAFPGFAAAQDDNLAPIKLIQDCYIHSYLLKNYAPIIMGPAHINTGKKYVYYSMSFPTLLEWASRSKISGSIMSDIRELRMLINLFIKTAGIQSLEYEYFHTEEDHLGEIKNASLLYKDDPGLLTPLSYKDNQNFPENGTFLRGCIRVTNSACIHK